MNFASFADLARDVLELIPFCLERDVSAVYGVPRSGLAPATILATALHVPVGIPGGELVAGRRVTTRARPACGLPLLIDDTVNHGGSLRKARAAMGDRAHLAACVYVTPGSEQHVDAYARQLPGPRVFEWNLFHCEQSPRFMFDLDGVFAFDPPIFDDDGPAYEAAITDARPKHIATWGVGWICTNRIARWRPQTLAWLRRYSIMVEHELLMQPYATAAERRARSTPAAFKAARYREAPGCQLFVESHESQAVEIARLSGRPVLAIDTMRLHE